ncbi:MAG: hypothetical protein QM775_29100 [Pirellulales bacterium]
MLTLLRRCIGAGLLVSFGAMLEFDIWLWTGDLDLADLQHYSPDERVAIIAAPFVEAAAMVLGAWLLLARPRNAAEK